MSVKDNKSKDASQKTAETVEAPEAVMAGQFAVPSNAIRMPLVLKTKVGDPKMDKTGKQTGTRGMNGLAGDELGITVNVYADPRALKLDAGQEYDVFIVPRQA